MTLTDDIGTEREELQYRDDVRVVTNPNGSVTIYFSIPLLPGDSFDIGSDFAGIVRCSPDRASTAARSGTGPDAGNDHHEEYEEHSAPLIPSKRSYEDWSAEVDDILSEYGMEE